MKMGSREAGYGLCDHAGLRMDPLGAIDGSVIPPTRRVALHQCLRSGIRGKRLHLLGVSEEVSAALNSRTADVNQSSRSGLACPTRERSRYGSIRSGECTFVGRVRVGQSCGRARRRRMHSKRQTMTELAPAPVQGAAADRESTGSSLGAPSWCTSSPRPATARTTALPTNPIHPRRALSRRSRAFWPVQPRPASDCDAAPLAHIAEVNRARRSPSARRSSSCFVSSRL